MTPITDPRPFAEVLRDWLDRNGLTAYAAAPVLGTTESSIGRWLAGRPCAHERAYRGLITLIDGNPAK
ncbi:MAG: hypothetical protein Q4G24_10540 [Paracoccus sp. (in: a-proteobacteria)]|uniref:hypothetical protein n=1 Tax=Paracoccus sp. TaxID=267 RepID=UPI0026DEC336|nr:hypothetical protein [Paracoccus sp. (in: a-proteobacteria)]MDO5621895.1 hypothetical protein [Paracoccus sp. (in: a-proteobacteria)]